MSDVKKSIEIAVNIIGGDPKVLKSILTAFEGVSQSVKSANKAIDSFKTSLNSIAVPASLGNIINSFKVIGSVKLTNIVPFVEGLKTLSTLPKIQDLNPFVTQIKTLSGLKIPNLNNIATGLKTINDASLDMVKVGARLRVLKRNLIGFTDIKIPNLNALVGGLDKLAKMEMSSVVKSIKELNDALKKLDQAGGIDSFKKFASDVSSMKTSFSSMAASITKVAKAVDATGKAAKKSSIDFRSFIDKFKTVAQFRTISDSLIALKQSMTVGATAIVEYDQALKDLQAITGATNTEIAAMGITILKIASTTKFSASEVAAGMRTIGQAGFSAAESMQTMQAVSNLATGTLSDMGNTVDLVTTAMRVYRIESSESSMVSDVFANAVNKSKLTIDKLRTAMNYVGPIARDSGVTFKELAAAMGTLANSGLRASTIGTGLRQVLAALVDPSDKLINAAANVGIALSDLDPRSNSLSSVMQNLNLVVHDSAVAFDIFGKRGASAVLTLSNAESGFDTMLSVISKQGTAAAQAAIQMEGLGVLFKNLQDKLKNLAIALGEAGISTVFSVLIDLGRDMVDVFTSIASSPLGKFVISLGVGLTALAAATSVAVISVIGLNKLLGFMIVETVAATASTSALGTAIAYVRGTFTALIGVINPWIALGTVVTVLFANWALSSRESTTELESAAGVFANLSSKLDTYIKNTASMEKGSKKLSEANKNLRTDLFGVANEYTEIAPLALAAAHSINAVTGEVIDGSKALNAYNAGLDALRLDKLLKSGEAASKSLGDQTGFFRNMLNNMSNDLANFKASITGNFTGEMVKAQKEARAFAKSVDDGTVSVKGINEYIANLDLSNLNTQQKDIIKDYSYLAEQAQKALKYLQDTGQISLQSSVEEVKAMAEQAGFGGRQLEEMLFQLKNLQEAGRQGFGNIVEKWDKEGINSIVDAIQAYKDLGGAITEAEEAQIRKNATDKKAFIDELNGLKASREAQLEAGSDFEQIWTQYHEKRLDLEKRSNNTAIELNNNRAAENIKALEKEKVALEKILKEIEAKYTGSSKVIQEARIREQTEAIAKYKENEAKLLQETIISQKVLAAVYKSHLQEMKTKHSEYIEDLAIQESKGLITNEEYNRKKLEAAVQLNEQLLAEAKRFLEETSEGDAEEYEKRYAAVLKSEQNLHKAKLSLIIAANKRVLKEEKEAQERLLSDQESIYKEYLQKLETAHAGHINELAIQESRGLITSEEFNKQKLASIVEMYSKQLEEAKEYQNQISELENPEEYKKRGIVVLKIEERLLKARLQKNINHNKELKKEQEQAQKERQAELKSLHNQYLQDLRTANIAYTNTLAIQESKGQLTNEEYNTKKLNATVVMYAEMLVAAKKYQEGVAKGQGKDAYLKAIEDTKKAEESLGKAKLAVTIATNKKVAKAEEDARKQMIADQKSAHLTSIKEKEEANADYNSNLALQLAQEIITEERYNDEIYKSKVNLHNDLLKEAILYEKKAILITGDVKSIEEERNRIVLEARRRLHKAELDLTIDSVKDRIAAEKSAAKEKTEAEKKTLAGQVSAYKNNIALIKAAHASFSEELAAKELLTKNTVLDLDVQLKEKLLKLAINHQNEVSKLIDTETYEKRNVTVLKAEEDLSNAQIRLTKNTQKEIKKASEERLKKENVARKAAFKASASAHKLNLELMETEHSKHIDNIAIQEAKGLITNEEYNAKKLTSTIEMYARKLIAAKKYQDSIDEELNPEKYAQGLIAIENLTQAHYKAKLAYDVSYNKAAAKTKEDLHNLEVSYNSKRITNEKALAEKLKSIDKDVADNRKSIASDIASIETSTEEKIRNVRNRSRTDSQKDSSDRMAAYKYLKQGQSLLFQASQEGDEEKLTRAVSLIKMSEGLAGGLKSEKTAVDILNKAMRALKNARNVKGELKELELLKKKNEEIAKAAQKQADEKALYKTKVDEATKAFAIIKQLESERHAREMANIKTANDLRIRNAQLQKDYAELGENFYLTEAQYIKSRGVELDVQNKAQITNYEKFLALEKEKNKKIQEASEILSTPVDVFLNINTTSINEAEKKLKILGEGDIQKTIEIYASANPTGKVGKIIDWVMDQLNKLTAPLSVMLNVDISDIDKASSEIKKLGNSEISSVGIDKFKDGVNSVVNETTKMIASISNEFATVSDGVVTINTDDSQLDSTSKLLEDIRDGIEKPLEADPKVSSYGMRSLEKMRNALQGIDDMYVSIKNGALHITNTPVRTTMDDTAIKETEITLENLAKTEINIKTFVDDNIGINSLTGVQFKIDELKKEPVIPIKIKVDPIELTEAQKAAKDLENDLIRSFGDAYKIKTDLTEIDQVKVKVESIKDRTIRIFGEVKGQEYIEAMKKSLQEMKDKIVKAEATVKGQKLLDKIQKSIDNLKDKTVTITTHYKSTGDKPSGYATGGRLPGFGGGDRIPILGEAGEWMINKFAVRKYGDSFLSQLNNMTLPKFQNGGSISPNNAIKQNIINNSTNSFEGFVDFGKVLIDTGKIKLPVIAHRNVVSELTNYMRKSSLMGVNA